MESAVRRIGVFTSGGDAPGMNAAIRSVVRTSLHLGIDCIGIRRGYHGLINGDIVKLDFESVSDISRRGGTMLYSARSLEFKEPFGQEKAIGTCKLMGLDALVGIGGDGTFQ
ncbi:MAG TPA: ATP-dependent 6-phosphofructokinase, partial [Clostridiales bacterium]|nr:ATP-dependent 6-phosphofructokinase [Clostridiales bacterium]